MKAADLLVACLENEGVRYLFGLPGEEVLDLLDSLSTSEQITFITCRHEQGAAFMADVYGRLTGTAGVCLGTLGPGATNLMTGVADANLDRSPVVAITGQTELANMHKEVHQFIDTAQMFAMITKWNQSVTKAETIPEIIHKAFQIAETEKKGATHIELPSDVAQEEGEAFDTIPKKTFAPQRPDPKSITQALQLIDNAKNPLIIAGNGVLRGDASPELRTFVRTYNIPVLTTFMGKGCLSAKENLHLGTVGLQQRDSVMCGIETADLIITIGMDVVEYSPDRWNPNREKTILHLDFEYPEADLCYLTTLDLIGDIKETLMLLNEHTPVRTNPRSSITLKEFLKRELMDHSDDQAYPLKPQKIIADLRKALRDSDILISDVGAHKLWLCRMFPVYQPNTFIVSNGFASMGIALPGALAAKIAKPHTRIVAVTGDGGFLMNIQELETAKRLGLDIVVVIFNDQRYGAIEWKQRIRFGRTFGSSFTNPDFVKLAESFGATGYRIENAAQFYPTLDEALRLDGCHILDVPVDFEENLHLTQHLGAFICPL